MTDQQTSPNVAPLSPVVKWGILWFLVGAVAIWVPFRALAAIDPLRTYLSSSLVFAVDFFGLGPPPNDGAPWAIHFTLNENGGALLRDLTRKNAPIPMRRHLAIIVDRQVMSAPTINSYFGTHAQISGNFSDEEIDHLVNSLRAGAEFRIVANDTDDKVATKETMRFINEPMRDTAEALEEARIKGGLPPLPRTQDLQGDAKTYDLILTNGAKSRVSYGWVQLGPPLLRSLGLDDAARNDPDRNSAWKEAARFRGQVTKLHGNPQWHENEVFHGALFYSRERRDPNQPDEAPNAVVDYFVLTRNPEIDPATGKQGATVGGGDLIFAKKESLNFLPSIWHSPNVADFAILSLLALVAGLVALDGRWGGYRWTFLIGQWAAVIVGVLVVLSD